MANVLKVKRSAVAGKIPTTTDLQLGELAINTNDGKLFIKKDDGTEAVVEVGAGGAALTTKAQFDAACTDDDFAYTGTANTFTHDQVINGVTVGKGAGTPAVPAYPNVVIGVGSSAASTSAMMNVAIGIDCLKANKAGNSNVAIGLQALTANNGTSNVAIGESALAAATTATTVVAIGKSALKASPTAAGCVAVGAQTLQSLTTGTGSTAIGSGALQSVTVGTDNTAVGDSAGNIVIGGSRNTLIGKGAGRAISSGNDNTLIGFDAGHAATGTAALSSGSNNTLIGSGVKASIGTVSNEITLGNGAITALRCQVQTITALSDARDKINVVPLTAGLDFVNRLDSVAWTWNARDGSKVGIPDQGFLAQQLKQVQIDTGHTIHGLVYESNPDKLEAGYGALIPVLVKAIQQLSAEVEILKRGTP